MKNRYKYFGVVTFVFILLLAISSCNDAQELKTKLSKIRNTEITSIDSDSLYTESYDVRFLQPLDHNNPEKGHFKQRVIINHVGYDRPTVVILEGYDLHSTKAGELSKLLNANQITIEHRFYGESQPDSLPWDLLNVKQAAADQHKIIQSLKNIYTEKWISTGISKGGQTTIFHRRFYPDDVDISVPYVAPLNFEREDRRIAQHLATVGSKECREKILNFQKALFENKEHILPFVKKHAQEKDYKFKNLGIERAYDINVLEYSFAFWQWSGNCDKIPTKNATIEEMLKHWISISPFSFFEVEPLSSDQLFSYQALTELGFYDYDISPFTEYLDDTVNITFDFKIPKGVDYSFNPKVMEDINNWLQNNGNYMLYIYGEYDPWGATGVTPSDNTIAVTMINPKGNHATRIKSFPIEMKQNIYNLLESWLDIEIEANKKKGLMRKEVLEIL
ncbi:MAG: S28 family serine protease [Bacteroidota bacterium]|nr:S28 family serine protease [Bacteroidota bacterium]